MVAHHGAGGRGRVPCPRAARRALDEARLRTALVQLALALQALHARGLVHRDVKPNNVLVTPAGRVVLLDFGLVAHVDQSESSVVGTPAYMAPEQCFVQEIGPPADWYGVGALLYEALTGALPFTGPALQVLKDKQEGLPRRPGELVGAPEDLDALCMELLAVDPAARPDAATVLARLEPTAIRTAPTPTAPFLFIGRVREPRHLGRCLCPDPREGGGNRADPGRIRPWQERARASLHG